MTQTHHTHQLVYVGQLEGAYGATYPLRWCATCGALYEGLDAGMAELLPEWTRDRVIGADWEWSAKTRNDYGRTPARAKRQALGRGLLEIKASLP